MGKLSEYKLKEVKDLKLEAQNLYRRGLTLRQVGNVLNRSHTWVNNAVKSLSTDGTLQKLPK